MDEDAVSSQDELKPPQQERWAPLGASSTPDSVVFSEPYSLTHSDRSLETLEKEKEELQQSLFSLTSRFAQIQFRLHQIVEAEPEDKVKLLEELDALANQGCVDNSNTLKSHHQTEHEHDVERHKEIINELKKQLDDLQSYAFQHGSGEVPQSVMLKKQQVVLEQLINKLGLSVDTKDLGEVPIDDLKGQVDDAVSKIVNPARIKEKLVDHLQTQIQDLERFVEFLQIEVESEGNAAKSSGSVPRPADTYANEKKKQNLALFRRALSILQMFAVSQLGCGTRNLENETMEENSHSSTEHLMNDLKTAVKAVRACVVSNDTDSDREEGMSNQELYFSSFNEKSGSLPVDCELTQTVRKELCPALINLLAHGLVVDATVSSNMSLVTPISCLLPRKLNTSLSTTPLHPWELFIEYYEAKKGADLAKAPSRMLTRSFDLEPLVCAGSTHKVSVKNSLLEAIHLVLNDHNPLKRSNEMMLKALICLGLNSGRLVVWIRLIMKTSWMISNHYTDYSYVARTGFEGALTVLSRLDSCSFNLPVDLAVRPFKNIRDAF